MPLEVDLLTVHISLLTMFIGEWVAGSAGMGFTPHIITIAVGEVWLAYSIKTRAVICKHSFVILLLK